MHNCKRVNRTLETVEMRRKQYHQVTFLFASDSRMVKRVLGFEFCFVETESHVAQAGPKLIM